VRRVIVKGRAVLASHDVVRDLCRNARLVPEGDEPSFADEFDVPPGATRARLTSRRCALRLEFLRG
jgi:hypothetical protein